MRIRRALGLWLIVGTCAIGLWAQDTVARATMPATEGAALPPPLKVALSGKALEKYSQARSAAVEHVAGKRCSTFLSSHGFASQDVAHALASQQPQDGTASSISFAAAGVASINSDPHGGDPIQTVFNNPAYLTMAVSQPRGTETYYNPLLLTRKIDYPYSNAVSVLHEALHNLTGDSDVSLAQELGYSGFEPLGANVYLNEILKKHCDSKR
jgi:hypothetical protein